MHTSIRFYAVAACLLGLGASVSAQEIEWQPSYSQARIQCQDAKRPLAVVVGDGSAGFNHLTLEGSLSPDIRKILVDHYVCVYLDTQKKENQVLLQTLTVQSGHGLILSDATAEVQAFFHDGKISASDLKQQLEKYSDASRKVTKTSYLTSTTFVSFQTPEPSVVRQSNYAPISNPIGSSIGLPQSVFGMTQGFTNVAPVRAFVPAPAPAISSGGRNC